MDAVSPESIARRVQRPLPYEFDMLAHLFVRQSVTLGLFPSLSPGARQRAAMQRALQRIERGEPAFQAPPDIDEAAILRDLDEWRERRRQVFDEVAYGAFLADFAAARSQTLSEAVRAAALDRLVSVLRPDFKTVQKRLSPAAKRRAKSGGSLKADRLLEYVITAATAEAVASANIAREYVFLQQEKFTHRRDGSAIVPAHDLRETDLRHALKARVRAIVEDEFASELAETGDAAEVSIEMLMAWGTARPRDIVESGVVRDRTKSGARSEQRHTPIGVDFASRLTSLRIGTTAGSGRTGLPWAKVTVASQPVFIEAATDKRARLCVCNRKDSCRASTPTPLGHIADTDGDVFSVEALHGVGTKGLDALEAEQRTRPQRAEKVEELKRLAKPEQRRLIEALLAIRGEPHTGYGSHADLAAYLGKRETAVRKMMFDLRAKIDVANVESPRWARPPQPAREIGGGTIPAHVFSADSIRRSIGFGFVGNANPPWPCTLPTHGFSSSSTAEGFLKPRNGVPA